MSLVPFLFALRSFNAKFKQLDWPRSASPTQPGSLPYVSITSPVRVKPNAYPFTHTVTGTASHPSGIKMIEVWLAGKYGFAVVTGANSWSFSASIIQPGQHTVTVRATDNEGHEFVINQLQTYEQISVFQIPQNSKFAACGDMGSNSNAVKVSAAVAAMRPEIFLALGDYSYVSASIEPWYTSIMQPIINASGDYTLNLGNHDFGNGTVIHPCKWDEFWSKFSAKFPSGRLYSSRDHKNVHILNMFAPSEITMSGSNTVCPGKTQADIDRVKNLIAANDYTTQAQIDFVKADLAAASSNPKIHWIIVCIHEPLYPVGAPAAPALVSTYAPIFQQYGVDLVLSGDRHNYQRTYPLMDTPNGPVVTSTSPAVYDWRNSVKGTIFNIVGTGGQLPGSALPSTKPAHVAKMTDGAGAVEISIENFADHTKLTSKFTYFANQYSIASSGAETYSITKGYDQ